MEKELIAPCGMNCALCVSYFGYTMTCKERKKRTLSSCLFILSEEPSEVRNLEGEYKNGKVALNWDEPTRVFRSR
ncbi:MAG: hypothetical protein ACOC53_04685 [Candidatus Saliniplasma sp.]